ncbi:hypothetical protein BU17DRAFT_90270 [Hysterangium stoloniferum]|nr:hypothetical protein BU17DRAFT_90270 [Hysterangium stoloniferum]
MSDPDFSFFLSGNGILPPLFFFEWQRKEALRHIQEPHNLPYGSTGTVNPCEVFHDFVQVKRRLDRKAAGCDHLSDDECGEYTTLSKEFSADDSECLEDCGRQSQPVASGSTTEVQASHSGARANHSSSSPSKRGRTGRGRKTVTAPPTRRCPYVDPESGAKCNATCEKKISWMTSEHWRTVHHKEEDVTRPKDNTRKRQVENQDEGEQSPRSRGRPRKKRRVA